MYFLKIALGMAAGGTAGYFWHKFVGCSSGGCPVVKNPYLSSVAGALVGLFLMLAW